MIFAEFKKVHMPHELHKELVEFIKSRFPNVQSGLQGDSWIWITDGNEKVEVDTFSSMNYKIKSASKDGSLVQKVIDTLNSKYDISILGKPELEGHED